MKLCTMVSEKEKHFQKKWMWGMAIMVLLGLLCGAAFLIASGKDSISRFYSNTLLAFFFIVLGMVISSFITYCAVISHNNKSLSMVYQDQVTGGGNFGAFKHDATVLFHENPSKKYVICYSDIKNFKYINDVYGFEVGNKILKRYSDSLGMENKLAYARINADNFVSIEEYSNEEDMLLKCEKRLERVSDVSGIIEGTPTISVFVGAYCTGGRNKELSVEGMIDRAIMAEKYLKNKEEPGCALYREEFREAMLKEQNMEGQMHKALKNGEFVVYIQPKFNIYSNEIVAAEALVRWLSPEQGLTMPMDFIPLFERNGFIKELDTYMFEQVCMLLRKWIDGEKGVCPVSVNISKAQFNNPDFTTDYLEIKKRYGIPDGLVEIEFTESMLFDNKEKIGEVLKFFRTHGFKTSIDDFGAGYSSLNLLKNLPTDILKLDRVFFEEGEYGSREKVIIRNVLSMARELSMQTVAEGVEKWEQVEFLKSVNGEIVQGFVFDKPLPAELFESKYIK